MAAGIAAILVATTAPAAGVAQAAPEGSAGKSGGPRSVTLITGDRVLVDVDGSAGELIAGPGREGVGFSTFEAGGHDYVVPLPPTPCWTHGSGPPD